MKLNYFKDQIFELLNESNLKISDIESDDRKNIFIITMTNGSVFEIECREGKNNLVQKNTYPFSIIKKGQNDENIIDYRR